MPAQSKNDQWFLDSLFPYNKKVAGHFQLLTWYKIQTKNRRSWTTKQLVIQKELHILRKGQARPKAWEAYEKMNNNETSQASK